MVYLISQDWSNTSGNHAGMVHMGKLLLKNYPNKYKLTVFPEKKKWCFIFKNQLAQRIALKINFSLLIPIMRFFFAIKFLFKIKNTDSVLLLEYLVTGYSQKGIAVLLKLFRPKVRVLGLCHLTPSVLEDYFSKKTIKSWLSKIDNVLTLGSSLTQYFTQLGIPSKKITTFYHYVDRNYYKRLTPVVNNTDRLKIIISGSQMRYNELVCAVVSDIEDVDFIICKGKDNVTTYPSKENIKLVGFVPEDELRQLMNDSDISLNIMVDTVGSNVITTSEAMGLAMIVSDVGSIRDYCDNSNTVFCKNTEKDFINAIKFLRDNREVLFNYKLNSLQIAEKYDISDFHIKLHSIISKN